MSVINKKTIKNIKNAINNGTRTIFVEGPADICLYKNFFQESEFKHFGSCDRIIEAVRKCNSELGKTPLVVGIIDRDDKTDKKEETLAKDNIFMLKEREIESIFLRQDVIEKLFGDTVFMQFSQEICKDATNRSNNTVANYQEALSILKKKLSSKYNIRMLLKTAKIKNKGNKENIELLSSMMGEKGVWKIIEDVIPKLPDIEQKDTFKAREKFQKKLQNFTPIKTEANSIDEGDEHEKRPEENKDIFKGS